jgi:hypothetical protein
MSMSVYWIKLNWTVIHFTGIALQLLFNNWIQLNNNTPQRQLGYWQPNLRTVAQVHSNFLKAPYKYTEESANTMFLHGLTDNHLNWKNHIMAVFKHIHLSVTHTKLILKTFLGTEKWGKIQLLQQTVHSLSNFVSLMILPGLKCNGCIWLPRVPDESNIRELWGQNTYQLTLRLCDFSALRQCFSGTTWQWWNQITVNYILMK